MGFKYNGRKPWNGSWLGLRHPERKGRFDLRIKECLSGKMMGRTTASTVHLQPFAGFKSRTTVCDEY